MKAIYRALALALVTYGLARGQSVSGGGGSGNVADGGTNGGVYRDSSGALHATATGGAGTLCFVSSNGGTPTFGSCAGSAATAWDSLTAPSGNLAIAMSTSLTAFTWSGNTSTNNLFSLKDTTGNTGTGSIFEVHTVGTSAAKPFTFTAKGTANGVQMDNTGSLGVIGTGAIVATSLPTTGLTGTITNAQLAGSIAASKLVGTDIATVGTITAGTWSATAIANSKGGTGGDSSGSTGIAKVASGTWSYATIVAADIAANAVTLAKLATQAADTTLVNATGSTAVPTAVAFPTTGTNGCAGSSDAIGYNTTSHAFVCNTISGGGSSAFSALTSSTNTTAAMVVGTGASLAASGSGTITATAIAVGGITGMGTGVGTFLATPSSANLLAAVTDETGSGGALVFATGPTISGLIGTGAADFSGAASLKIRVAAGLTAATNGFIGYDSTNNMLHASQSAADAFVPQFTVTPTNAHCVTWVVSGSNYKLGDTACSSGGTVTVSGGGSLTSTAFMTGAGTTVSQTPSATSTLDSSGNATFAGTVAATSISTGTSPPSSSVCTAGTAGGLCLGEGTTPTGTLLAVGVLWENSSNHRLELINNNSTSSAVPTLISSDAFTNKTYNGLTVTSTTGTFTLTNGKTLSVSNTLTLAGTDSTTMTFPSTSATIARTDAANTFTGTQDIGALVATTVNGNTFTTGTGVLTLAAGKTLTASNSITFAGTDSTTMTFPTTSATIARTDAGQTFTGTQVLTATIGSTSTATTQSQSDNSTKVATTAYTDLAIANAIAAVNPAIAVLAASTASLTGTYSNGVAGIGATFTVTATGAFTLDGIAINAIGQRILLKNQSSAFQNGMYTATVVGTTGVSPVFTRALDYDAPSDINSTGAIPVQSGTANGDTSWLLTSAVTTVGTDALTYVQFTIAPTSLVTAASPGVGLCHFAGSTQACTSSAVSLTADVSGVLPTANIAVALANQTSINGLAITASTGTLAITNGKTFSVSNTLTFAGIDGVTYTGPSTSQTLPGMNQTNTAGSSMVWDLSVASVTAGLKIPSAAGAVPTADGFEATNTTNHTHVWGSNGTTMVGAIAATGTGTATTCTNQFVSVISSIAVPTCTTVTLAGAQFANQGTTTTVLHGNGAGNPTFGAVVSADLNITTTTCVAPTVLTAISAGGVGTCTAPLLTQNSQSAAYTTVLGDAGKMIYHPGADTTARTFTIDSNANVAYLIGTCISFFNDTSAGALTIAITSDTLVLAGAGTTGSRTLTASNVATACKMTSTRWMISGSSGLT